MGEVPNEGGCTMCRRGAHQVEEEKCQVCGRGLPPLPTLHILPSVEDGRVWVRHLSRGWLPHVGMRHLSRGAHLLIHMCSKTPSTSPIQSSIKSILSSMIATLTFVPLFRLKHVPTCFLNLCPC
jgi:hypothetical protein